MKCSRHSGILCTVVVPVEDAATPVRVLCLGAAVLVAAANGAVVESPPETVDEHIVVVEGELVAAEQPRVRGVGSGTNRCRRPFDEGS